MNFQQQSHNTTLLKFVLHIYYMVCYVYARSLVSFTTMNDPYCIFFEVDIWIFKPKSLCFMHRIKYEQHENELFM